jgi:hypothetical protein
VFRVAQPEAGLGLVSQGPQADRLTADTVTRPDGGTMTLPVVQQAPAQSFAVRLADYANWLREQIAQIA